METSSLSTWGLLSSCKSDQISRPILADLLFYLI